MLWGPDKPCLLHDYRSLVRCCLDRRSLVYGSARPIYLKRLDPGHNLAMRLSCGGYWTFPVVSRYVEASKPSLNDRTIALACAYILSIRERTQHLCYPIVTTGPSRMLFTNRPQSTRPLLLRFEEIDPKANLSGRLPDTAQNHVHCLHGTVFRQCLISLLRNSTKDKPQKNTSYKNMLELKKNTITTHHFSQMVRKPQLTSEVQYWRGTGKQWQDFRSVRQYLLLSVTLSW